MFNCLGVLAQTSVCLTSCAPPQETQYRVYLTCCKSHSWPVSSPMHGAPRSLCSRAPAGTGTQGRHCCPRAPLTSLLYWASQAFQRSRAPFCDGPSRLGPCLILCQSLPLVLCYHHPRAPILHVSHAVCPILLPLHCSHRIPEWGRILRECSDVVFCSERACLAHLPLLQLTCCRSSFPPRARGAAGL